MIRYAWHPTATEPRDCPEDYDEQPNWHNCRRCWVLYFGDAGELCELCAAEDES